MQLLTFTLGQQQYGIDTRSIVEVLPFISANPVPQQGEEIRGLVRYRGNLVPVIDLCQLIADRPCQLRLGTRTVVVRTAPIDSKRESSLFAITAEDVVGMSTTVADVETPEHSESFIGPIVDIENARHYSILGTGKHRNRFRYFGLETDPKDSACSRRSASPGLGTGPKNSPCSCSASLGLGTGP